MGKNKHVMLIPPRPRIRIEDKGYVLEIDIPPRRDAATILPWLFLTGWLGGWAIGEGFAIIMLWRGLHYYLGSPDFIDSAAPSSAPSGFAFFFLLFWLLGWTAGGLMALYFWLHLMWGRERITIEGTRLRIETFPWGRAREFETAEIQNMRLSEHVRQRSFQWRTPQRHTGGALCFDYGGRQYNFGATLDPTEAQEVLAAIGRRYKWMLAEESLALLEKESVDE